jgi:hypothetical protein
MLQGLQFKHFMFWFSGHLRSKGPFPLSMINTQGQSAPLENTRQKALPDLPHNNDIISMIHVIPFSVVKHRHP